MLQLCSSKSGRKYIRDKNAYVILRELHSGEKDPAVLLTAENLISMLISDEPAPGMEDLTKVEIPEEIEEKLRKAHEAQQREVEEETEKLEAEKLEAEKLEAEKLEAQKLEVQKLEAQKQQNLT